MSKDTSGNHDSRSGNGPRTEPAAAEQFLIVGLGASAGGIQALKSFFTEVPKDSGLAYVVILHMSPEHESKLAEILQVVSPIPVTQVRKRTKVEPNHVYVVPPNKRLALADGHLELKNIIGVEERRSPVDLFFRTLAETNEHCAVSVILSGTGADGSMGLKRVKEHGGVAFVQDPDEAEYTDMPRNAIATGMVDYVLPVAEIPAKIISYKNRIAPVEVFKTPTEGLKMQYEVQQEELRASNEELQAMNEELRSTVEELETSKEELQSVNEELFTVNQELKIKIEELSLSNNNFQNLMNSTDIGTIFLDRSFRVRQFTPSARETFNLIQSDIGRPLLDITSKIDVGELHNEMEAVLRRLQPHERLVTTPEGHSYVLRITPYRTLDDRIEGLVITLVDITVQTKAEKEVKVVYNEMESRVAQRTAKLSRSNLALGGEIEDKVRSEEARQLLLEELVRAQEDERSRLARDLHDHLGQRLTTLRMRIESLKDPAVRTRATPDELQEIVKALDADVDFLAWELRPIALDELGLDTALSKYAKQWSEHFDATAEFHARGLDERRLPLEVESNLYRIAQEALNNCAKHAKCTRASIILERRDHHVILIIEDNGAGFNASNEIELTQHMGLMSMKERTALMGGTFDIESMPTKGTTIFVRVHLTGEPNG